MLEKANDLTFKIDDSSTSGAKPGNSHPGRSKDWGARHFQRLNTEGSTPDVESIHKYASRSKRVVYLFWGTSLTQAFLGLTTPF